MKKSRIEKSKIIMAKVFKKHSERIKRSLKTKSNKTVSKPNT